MFVKKILAFDKNSGEADILVTDGKYELMCYCYLAEIITTGLKVKEISAFFAENAMRTDSQEYLIRKSGDHYSYYLHGRVLDKQKPLIGLGELFIKLDKPLAKDIKENEFVEFAVERLDCFLEKTN